MTVHAKLRATGLILDPQPAAGAGPNELYINSSTGQLSSTDGGGATTPIGAAPTADSALLKVMQNLSGATIPANALVAKLVSGGICAAISDVPTKNAVIGIAKESIADNATGSIGLLGPNQPGVLTGLSFAPGDKVYMAESSGAYTNDINSFTGSNDRIVRVGIADCAAGAASGVVVDLISILTVEVADQV